MVRAISYFPTEADALANTNPLPGNVGPNEYAVETRSGYSSWRIAPGVSTGSSSQAIVYQTGNVLNNDGIYRLYPGIACFLEGTKVLCNINGFDKYVPIETLKPGTLVKTSLNGYKKIQLIGKGTIENRGDMLRTENRLYKCCTERYPELKDDLYITGCHSILVDNIPKELLDKTLEHLGNIFITEKKYRLIACIDERAEPWMSEGTYPIWHLALENDDDKMNYGIYVNGGLLVETTSINFMKNKSNMTLV